ncbi:Tryptophan biosynthesis protein TrpCF [Providencia stuartii]|nr:Tryptophan biosynthesis protein TrpCF [Providencia stuartii]
MPLHYNMLVFSVTNLLILLAHMVEQLALSAVQLHGHEDADYVKNLRNHLPEHCEIWKAVNMSQPDFSQFDGQPIDLLLLDNGRGGSGQTFDWNKIPNSSQFRVMVAGGLNADNCRQAATLLCNGLDFNSGVETEPGIKSEKKLNQVFSSLAL